MHNKYCKNCKNIVGKWSNKFQDYNSYNFCYLTELKKNKLIYFLDCINCNRYVGLLCNNVCKNCFGENELYKEEKLFNWFLKYKKIQTNQLFANCKICDNQKFRWQYWFFDELTFNKR